MIRLTWDGIAEPVSRDEILRRERGQGNTHFLCSADHEQDGNLHPVDPYILLAIMCDHTYISHCSTFYSCYCCIFFMKPKFISSPSWSTVCWGKIRLHSSFRAVFGRRKKAQGHAALLEQLLCCPYYYKPYYCYNYRDSVLLLIGTSQFFFEDCSH